MSIAPAPSPFSSSSSSSASSSFSSSLTDGRARAARSRAVAATKPPIAFMMCSAYREVTGYRLGNGFSLGDGHWFCDLRGHEVAPISEDIRDAVDATMQNWLKEGLFECTYIPRKQLLKYYHEHDYEDKIEILKIWRADPLPGMKCGGKYMDYMLRKSTVETDVLQRGYKIMIYRGGLLVRFPWAWSSDTSEAVFREFTDHPRFFETVIFGEQLAKTVGVDTAGHLNSKVFSKKALKELVLVEEAFHERRIADIALMIVNSFPQKKVVCISGPSSSGKTTSSKRIMIQLKSFGFDAILLGMDQYYKDFDDVPTDSNGRRNYEILEAIDIELLASDVSHLRSGKSVPKRIYSFFDHCGRPSHTEFLTLSEKSVIICEGIHGLHPRFTEMLGGPDAVTRIFVSATQHLGIDHDIHFTFSDNRLLRRIIRDYRSRGYSAEDTLSRWGMVRAGEEDHIFPASENADTILDTSLTYELSILASHAIPVLAEVDCDSPDDEYVNMEAHRLITLASLFYPVADDGVVPPNSILREFIGDSVFQDGE